MSDVHNPRLRAALSACLERALSGGGDFAQAFYEDKDENCTKRASGASQGRTSVKIHGAGLQLLQGTRGVYVYGSDTSPDALLRLADRAASLLRICGAAGSAGDPRAVTRCEPLAPCDYPRPNPIIMENAADSGRRARFLADVEAAARGCDAPLTLLNADLFETDQHVIVADSEGVFACDRRVSTRLRLQAALGMGGRTTAEWGDLTRPQTFEDYIALGGGEAFARNFVLDLAASMNAKSVRGGEMPVVMEAGCGTLWHEACGHMLEAGAIFEKTSPFAGRMGEKIASDKVTLLDDGGIPGLYGSAAMDDEGQPTRRNILIEKGVLRGFLCDKLGGRRVGMPSTGSGRRQGYAFAPCARMTNTYLAAGEDDEEEMLRSVERGLFVKRLGGGNSGRSFSIAVSEGYLIEHGKIGERVFGLVLTGSGEEIMKRVDRVGKICQYEESGGFCGSVSGLVPVTAFQPRMRISHMNVGGEG